MIDTLCIIAVLVASGTETALTSSVSKAINANDDISLASTGTNTFTRIAGDSGAGTKIIDCVDGYAYSYMEWFMAPYTTKSNLMLIHNKTSFTPGYVAAKNGESGYDGSRYLYSGYFHYTLERYVDAEKGKVGPSVVPQAMWPLSTTYETTISSSFGVSLGVNVEDGAEYDVGDDAMKVVAKEGASLAISYSTSLSTVGEEPSLSAQYSPSNPMEAQWSYQFKGAREAGCVTYILDTYYLFEIDNYSAVNCGRDSFIITVSARMTTYYQYGWFGGVGWDYDYSNRILCFA